MTGTYDWNPMPHQVEINCPSCGSPCVFEFAEVVKIKQKKDVPFFEQSDIFDYSVFTDSCGHKWHGAVYFANLHGGSTKAITNLPDGYSPESWSHSRYLVRNHGLDLGAFSCNHCLTRKPYILQWPQDAYYSFNYKGAVLWAFHRESAIDLRDYIASYERKPEEFKWSSFLLHVPTIFKKQNAREPIVRQINKLLA
ncbi:hypothetical protein [Reinekea blandensis]|nr:hypothetical protein [Reinekea blandensis]